MQEAVTGTSAGNRGSTVTISIPRLINVLFTLLVLLPAFLVPVRVSSMNTRLLSVLALTRIFAHTNPRDKI
jgi:hypothetical protein